MQLFKDKIPSSRNSEAYPILVAELAAALDSSDASAVPKLLFGESKLGSYPGAYQLGDHNRCDGFANDVFWATRLCKCLYYRNNGYPTRCDSCAFTSRFYLRGDYHIVDYEVPSFFCGKNIGEIDLVLQKDNLLYATEVKPYADNVLSSTQKQYKGNKETLLRMVAEILTYTAFFEKNRHDGSPTAQQQEYQTLSPLLLHVIKKAGIAVFRFEEDGADCYQICKL